MNKVFHKLYNIYTRRGRRLEERVKSLRVFDPEMDYGKDGRLAKERLKKYSPNEIRELIDWYLSSENFERFGTSLSVCLSNFIINLWKACKLSCFKRWYERERVDQKPNHRGT